MVAPNDWCNKLKMTRVKQKDDKCATIVAAKSTAEPKAVESGEDGGRDERRRRSKRRRGKIVADGGAAMRSLLKPIGRWR